MVDQRCLFCGRPLGANRVKEHVVPAWLLRHLDVEHEIVIPAVARTEDSEIVGRRRHSADAMLEGHTCEDCNHGWMGRLEDEAKPILIPLIEADRPVFGLSDT